MLRETKQFSSMLEKSYALIASYPAGSSGNSSSDSAAASVKERTRLVDALIAAAEADAATMAFSSSSSARSSVFDGGERRDGGSSGISGIDRGAESVELQHAWDLRSIQDRYYTGDVTMVGASATKRYLLQNE